MMESHFIGLRGVQKITIENLLLGASRYKEMFEKMNESDKTLTGKTIAVLFYENSTRTRLSFELAAKSLGATVISISADSSSVQKGETVLDTLKNIQAMGFDCVVMRHPESGVFVQLANSIEMTLVNAGDGMNEHPTQALLDLLTLRESIGVLENKSVLIFGDIQHSRVARSNIWGLQTMGAHVILSGPREWVPLAFREWNVSYEADLGRALEKADAVIALRIQKERQDGSSVPKLATYNELYGLNIRKMEGLASKPVILHPGPVNRGLEITSDLLDGPCSRVYQQVQNGVAVRMAVLNKYVGGS